MLLRSARPDEAEQLTELALRSKAHWGYDTAFMAQCVDELTMTAGIVTRDQVTVAEQDGHVVGFVSVAGEPPHGRVAMMFVAPGALRRGIGRALFTRALDRARDTGFARLTFDADPHAVGFYEAMGAVRTGSVPSGSITGRMLPFMEVTVGDGAGRA